MTTPDPSERTPPNTPLPGSPLPGTPPTAPSTATPAPPPTPPLPPRGSTASAPTPAASTPEAARLASRKPSALTVLALAGAGLSLILGLIGIGVGVSAQARNVQLQQELDQLEAQQDAVDSTLAALDQRTGTSLAEYLDGLDFRLSRAESMASGAASRAEAAASRAGFAEDYAFSVDSRLEEVVDCINRYMKTVGDSGGGYYQYFFC